MKINAAPLFAAFFAALSVVGVAHAEGTDAQWFEQHMSSKPRAEVAAQAAALPSHARGEEIFRLADQRIESTKSRAQVIAETREAHRLGLIALGDYTPQATPEQQRLIQLAGDRVRQMEVMAMNRY